MVICAIFSTLIVMGVFSILTLQRLKNCDKNINESSLLAYIIKWNARKGQKRQLNWKETRKDSRLQKEISDNSRILLNQVSGGQVNGLQGQTQTFLDAKGGKSSDSFSNT